MQISHDTALQNNIRIMKRYVLRIIIIIKLILMSLTSVINN